MKFIIILLVCLLGIFAASQANSRVRRGGCYCNRGRGTYCGSTKRIGQLSGDCSEHDMYYCSSGNRVLSKWEGNCKRGCYAATGGRDYCK